MVKFAVSAILEGSCSSFWRTFFLHFQVLFVAWYKNAMRSNDLMFHHSIGSTWRERKGENTDRTETYTALDNEVTSFEQWSIKTSEMSRYNGRRLGMRKNIVHEQDLVFSMHLTVTDETLYTFFYHKILLTQGIPFRDFLSISKQRIFCTCLVVCMCFHRVFSDTWGILKWALFRWKLNDE